ncbi:hypothetical protein HID58_074651, partial [Brassica napus]
MLYISHADPTERLARIERVKQSIKDTKDQREHQRPIITTDISQGKGMVFRYTEDGETLKSISSSGGEQASKLGAPLITQEAERVESGASSSQSLYTESSTGFISLLLTPGPTVKKKQRNRPPAWKRRLRTTTVPSKLTLDDNPEDSGDSRTKRKATDPALEEKHKGHFFFDKRMMGRRGVEEAIARSWDPGDTTSASSIMDCIARCRMELAKLKRSENMNSKTKIEKLKADLEKEIASQFPNFQRMRRLKQELSVSLLEEEKFWRQWSRVEWLKEGDRNTVFFHNEVRGRRLKNKVLMLHDVFGQENYSEGSKGNIAVEFYRDLFMSSNPMDMEPLFVGFPVKIMLSSSVSPSLHYLTSQITALLHKFEDWSLDHATDERNVAANMIAGSVTTGHRYQSYIASQGPAWLYSLLSREAR